MLGMYGQRCGQAVSITVDDDHWSHRACHKNDAYLDYLTARRRKKRSLGGWHDAGDFGKYVTNGAFSAGTMLAAWEHFQPMLSTLSIPAIPEHGGALPDFLAEVKWELDWLLTTQGGDGSVSHKVTALDFEAFEMPEKDGSMRYFTPVGTAATGDLVAVLAQAARIYAPYDQADRGRYLAAARLGLHVPEPRTREPPCPTSATHSDRRLRSKVGCLQPAVGRRRALGDDRRARRSSRTSRATSVRPSVDENFDWGSVRNLGLFTYLMSKRDGRNPTLVAGLTTSATTVADGLAATAQASAFGRGSGGILVGSNGAVARTAMNLWVAYQLSRTRNISTRSRCSSITCLDATSTTGRR